MPCPPRCCASGCALRSVILANELLCPLWNRTPLPDCQVTVVEALVFAPNPSTCDYRPWNIQMSMNDEMMRPATPASEFSRALPPSRSWHGGPRSRIAERRCCSFPLTHHGSHHLNIPPCSTLFVFLCLTYPCLRKAATPCWSFLRIAIFDDKSVRRPSGRRSACVRSTMLQTQRRGKFSS